MSDNKEGGAVAVEGTGAEMREQVDQSQDQQVTKNGKNKDHRCVSSLWSSTKVGQCARGISSPIVERMCGGTNSDVVGGSKT